MSFRLVFAIALLGLAACSTSDLPLQTDDAAFTYTGVVANGMPVYVRNMRGSIDVEPSPDDSVRVTATMTWRGTVDRPRDMIFSAVGLPTGLLVCAIFGDGECTMDNYSSSSKRRSRREARDVKVAFRVQVPLGVSLDLLGVDTRITSASTAPVRARSMNGDVTVVTAQGPVRAETMNGDVDARMTTLSGPDSVIAKTMNGNAWAFLPQDVAATYDIATTNGRVESDFPAIAGAAVGKSFSGGLNGGGTPVRVRTLNGTAGLARLDAEGRSFPR